MLHLIRVKTAALVYEWLLGNKHQKNDFEAKIPRRELQSCGTQSVKSTTAEKERLCTVARHVNSSRAYYKL